MTGRRTRPVCVWWNSFIDELAKA